MKKGFWIRGIQCRQGKTRAMPGEKIQWPLINQSYLGELLPGWTRRKLRHGCSRDNERVGTERGRGAGSCQVAVNGKPKIADE